MENNKVTLSLTTIIIIAVIIGALLLGIISFIVYNSMNKNDDSILSQTQNTEQTQTPSTLNEQMNKTNNIPLTNSGMANNNNNNSSQSSSVTGKSSSKSNPLSIGEWGLASKYSSGNYVDVSVKVTNVTRGNSATQMVKNYCNNGSSIYRYEDAKDGMEWAVVDYVVDLSKIEAYSSGDKPIKVDSKVTGTGNNTSIKYNGNTYIVSTMNMTSGNSKENIANGQFAVQLPIGCTDYLIVLGSSSHTQAFFNGK